MARRRWRGPQAATTIITAVAALACGCGASQERIEGASGAAVSFAEAVQAGDGAAMCAVLARETKQELERSERTTCDEAVVKQQLATIGPVRETDVHGRQAMVKLKGDTLFLSEMTGGWKITAAGCTPRPGQPYQCQVKGG
ncbi:hypothetical protein [Streptomyces radiopugnans]|uniref:hypothetical protein n=1 Tax=Streptomyces radiopugnans TaxID=403935 RepID=UPI003F1C1A72